MKAPSVPLKSDPNTVHQQLARLINGNLEFGSPAKFGAQDSPQNISGSWWQGTSPATPDTDFAVPHKLGFVPTGYDVKNINKAAHVYQGVTPWTNTTIYLRCDQASVALTLFVI